MTPAASEFDEGRAHASALGWHHSTKIYSDKTTHPSVAAFIEGARWQHSQMLQALKERDEMIQKLEGALNNRKWHEDDCEYQIFKNTNTVAESDCDCGAYETKEALTALNEWRGK